MIWQRYYHFGRCGNNCPRVSGDSEFMRDRGNADAAGWKMWSLCVHSPANQ